jgi:hypothetical protein
MPSSAQKPQQWARAPEPDPYDGRELSDDDLEFVVGGVDPEYWYAQSRYLQELYGVPSPDGK